MMMMMKGPIYSVSQKSKTLCDILSHNKTVSLKIILIIAQT